jgi:two-component system phosphate regulon sensor histidine kinase PhoR
VARGTTEDAAKTLLLDRLDNLVKNLGNAQNKLVHLAVFDHAYQGRPQNKPLATLAWKDWRGEPQVVFPGREDANASDVAKETAPPAQAKSTPPPARTKSTPPPARPFPTTLYNWRLQIALTTADDLEDKVERQRLLELGMVAFAGVVVLVGMTIIVLASIKERHLAALKSDFVANVSHELKTPLALVRMFGEILLADRVPSDEKRRQYLQIIVSESERLTALIENVLDFAKVERGKAAYEFAPGRLDEVVARAVEVYRYRAERDGIAVHLAPTEELPLAMIDARAVELAIINLLDNAFKYAKDGGRVDVEFERQSEFVLVRIRDQGPGIDPDEQERIFERFVRGRRAGENRVRGSGIGLALVKHIAESHGGTISVTSPITQDRRGSMFVFRIPILRGEALRAAARAALAEGKAAEVG